MNELPSAQLSKFILPPECPDHNTYGYLYVEIGKLLWLKGGKPEHSKVKIKFWGDKGAGQILRPVNASKELHMIPTAIQYEIRCPLVSFYNYLSDSTRLKFFVLDARNDKALGNVIIQLPLHLNHNLTKNDTTPLNEINDSFPIQKLVKPETNELTAEKIGELEIKVSAAFHKQEQRQTTEQRVPRGLLDSADHHLTSSFQMNEIRAEEAAKSTLPRDLYGDDNYQDPSLTYNRDRRIPTSLLPGKDETSYNANSFRPQEIFRLPQNTQNPYNTSPQRQTQTNSIQGLFNVNSPPKYQGENTMNIRDSYRAPQNLNDKQMDLLEDLFLKQTAFHDQILAATKDIDGARQTFGSGFGFDASRDRIEPYRSAGNFMNFDLATNPLNQSTELERAKLEVERLLLEGNSEQVANTKNEDQDTKKKGPLNFNEIENLKINISEWVCENITLREKINDRQIFIECHVPSSAGTLQNPVFDTYKFFAKNAEGLVWNFKNEISQPISQKEGEFKKMFNSNILFKLFMTNPDTTGKGSSDVNFEIASGELSVEKIMYSPNYSGTFYVKMSSRAPLNQPQQPQKTAEKETKGSKKGSKAPPQKTTKPAAALVRTDTLTEVGDLKVFCQFTGSRQVEEPEEREEKEKRSTFARNQEGDGDSYVPLQTMLYIDRIPKITPRKDLQFPFRNVYISYKIYGTQENIQTDIRWKTNTPYFDHKMVFPLSLEHLFNMYKVPLILVVWDKSESGKDELVGLVKLPLEKVPNALLDEDGDLNNVHISANQYPVLVYDDSNSIPIIDPKTGQENGQIQLILAVGTPGQLNKFESKLQQKRGQYTEVPERIRYVSSPERTIREEPEQLRRSQAEPEERRESPQKNSPFKKYEVNLDENERVNGVNAYESFVEVMERIRKHSDEATIKSQPLFMSKEKVMNAKDLTDFLLEPSYTIKGDYCRKVVKLLDLEKKGLILREYFTRSYLTYVGYEAEVRGRFSEIARNLKTLLNQRDLSVLAFEKVLNSHSQFGYIKKSALKETFEKMNINLGPQMMEYILGLLDYENNGLVFISHLTDYLKALEVYNTLNFLNLNPHFFIEKVASMIKDVLKANDITKERIDNAFQGLNKEDKIIRIDNVIQILVRLGCDLTFWEALSLLEHVKSKMNVINSEETRVLISGKVLYAWLYMAIGRDMKIKEIQIETGEDFHNDVETPGRFEPPKPFTPQKKEIQESPKKEEIDQNNSIDDIAELLNSRPMKNSPRETSPLKDSDLRKSPKESLRSNSPKISPKSEKKSLVESDNIIQEQPKSRVTQLTPRHDKPDLPLPPKQQKERPQKTHRGLFKHVLKLTINEISQLNLGQRYEGSRCTVRYIFPSTQDMIESNVIEIQEEQRDYQIDLVSKYTWTLNKNENLIDHLKNPSDGVILQLVKKDEVVDEVLGYVILPFDDLSFLVDRAETDSSGKSRGILHKTLLFLRSGQSRGFSFQNDLVIAKLTVVLEYEKSHPLVTEEDSDASDDEEVDVRGKSGTRSRSREVKEVLYEKETSLLRLIPKKGFFIFKIDAISELKRGLEYVSEKNKEVKDIFNTRNRDGPKLAVYFDIFWEERNLKNVVAPFEVDLPGRQIDLDEVIVDKTVSKYAEMSADLIDYIQHKTAKVEVRLYLGNEEENEEGEIIKTRKNMDYIVICGCKVPLLSLFTSEKVQGEFPLTNNMEYYCGLLSLQISFNKENKIGLGARSSFMKNKDKSLYVVALSFNELLSVIETEERGRIASDKEEGDTIFYLEFEVEENVKRSTFYSLNKWKERIPLEDCFFTFTVDAHSEFFRKPLEVRLLEKRKPRYQDKVIGFASLDFFGVLKNHLNENRTFIESFYCPLSDIEKAKVLKTRLGVKAGIVKVKNQTEGKKLTKYLNVVLGGDLSQSSQKVRTQTNNKFTGTLSRTKLRDTFKQQTKLTYGELDDFSGLLSEEGDIVSWEIFTREVRPDLHLEIPIDPEVWRTLLADFVFYDTSGEGFISAESAKSILTHYSEEIKDFDEEEQSKYKVVLDIKGLTTGYPKRARNMFDYVVFLNKLELVDRREQYRKIYENTRKVDAFVSSKLRSRSPSPYKSQQTYQPSSSSLKLQAEIQYGKNFQQLNQGKPPNSLVRFELGSRSYTSTSSTQRVLAETSVVSRASDPDFNVLKEQTIDNLEDYSNKGDYGFIIKVFHRTFNANHSEEMYKLNLVGEGFISLRNIAKQDGTVYFNDFLDIQPVFSSLGSTQTSRPMLKIKLTGNLSSQYEARERRDLKESIRKPYERVYVEEDNDDVPELDNEIIKNFQKTLAEVNQDTQNILGSAEKAKRVWHDDNENEDIDDRLQSHSKAIRDIANITANLDNFLGTTSFREPDYFSNEERRRIESPLKEEKESNEGGDIRLTGTFAGGITRTNPFARNLDENVESPYKEKSDLISPGIKAEMPEEFKDVPSSDKKSENRDEEIRDWKRIESEAPQRTNVGDKENSSENAGLSRPSEDTGKKESSITSGSVAKPPLDDSSSTSTFRKLEQKLPKSMRNTAEIDRIKRIMKTSTAVPGKKVSYTSDSD